MMQRVLIAVVAVAALAAGIWWQQSAPVPGGNAALPAASQHNAIRPEFSLPDIDGSVHSITEWDGKVLLVNFWATWCPPCREEMPMFVELQDEYGGQGLQIIGIAIDDTDKVRAFMDTIGVNYPVLVGAREAMAVGTAWGNHLGALPYTVVVDRAGTMAWFKRGQVDREAVLAAIIPLL